MDDFAAQREQPIRVAYLIDNVGVAGTEQWLLRLIDRLDPKRVEPYLCLLDGESDASRSFQSDTIRTLRLGLKSFKRPIHLRQAARAYLRFLRQHRIEIVQLHFPDSTLFGAPLARWAGVQHVISTSRNTGYSLTRWQRLLGSILHGLVTATVANSDASKRAVVDALGVPAEKVKVIPNGVDHSRFQNDRPFRLEQQAGQPWRVGIVANLRPIKDIPTFIRAAARLLESSADVEFLIVGEGPMRGELQALIDQLGIARHVRLVGIVRDIPKFLAQLDVAVLCSKAEGLSNALLEYMAAGIPVVATAVGGNTEVVSDNVTGLLVPPCDVAALSAAILRQIEDRERARALAAKGREYISTTYSVANEARNYVDFYDSLCMRPTTHIQSTVASSMMLAAHSQQSVQS